MYVGSEPVDSFPPPPLSVYRNGLQTLRLILATEGVRGLYRGFFASVSLFVPQSTLWWGSYGLYQKVSGGPCPRHVRVLLFVCAMPCIASMYFASLPSHPYFLFSDQRTHHYTARIVSAALIRPRALGGGAQGRREDRRCRQRLCCSAGPPALPRAPRGRPPARGGPESG